MYITGKHFVRDNHMTIQNMGLGGVGYTVQWAFSLNYSYTQEPCGTSNAPICRTEDGFAFIGRPGRIIGEKP